MKIAIHWFRRDLRLDDNTALHHAMASGFPVLPLFVFDKAILDELSSEDARVAFIHKSLKDINEKLVEFGSSIKIIHDNIFNAWEKIVEEFDVEEVYVNRDYEPYGLKRDSEIFSFLKSKEIVVNTYKDQVIFEPDQILKDDGTPYKMYTPYKNKWLKAFDRTELKEFGGLDFSNLTDFVSKFPLLSDLGFKQSKHQVEAFNLSMLDVYQETRDVPFKNGTSFLGPHLRFGTVSIRSIIKQLGQNHEIFLSELVWREFFMQILYHFPRVVNQNFKLKYDGIKWRNDTKEFKLWCDGKTGYPIVDAGMRQLNATGYMHNRVRMITASFLCKHLLIDWRWGEAYFAEKLLDFELSSNNGNWQWVAGTGCDSAPYFRVFNPTEQTKKFDTKLNYVKQWVSELNELDYRPMVDHKMARIRAIETYKKGLESSY